MKVAQEWRKNGAKKAHQVGAKQRASLCARAVSALLCSETSPAHSRFSKCQPGILQERSDLTQDGMVEVEEGKLCIQDQPEMLRSVCRCTHFQSFCTAGQRAATVLSLTHILTLTDTV
eukprot:1014662-Pleurochrysis_carterae.AAC.4